MARFIMPANAAVYEERRTLPIFEEKVEPVEGRMDEFADALDGLIRAIREESFMEKGGNRDDSIS